MQQFEPTRPGVEPAVGAELRSLVQKAQAGDVSVLPRLRQILDTHPEIWQHGGDLEKIVVRGWVDLLSGNDPLSKETVLRKAEQLRADLEGENPAPLEKLLVGVVVSNWLELSHAQLNSAAPGEKLRGQAGYNLKRAESVQRRYVQSMRMLATVRSLLPRGLLPTNHLRAFDPSRKQLG